MYRLLVFITMLVSGVVYSLLFLVYLLICCVFVPIMIVAQFFEWCMKTGATNWREFGRYVTKVGGWNVQSR